MTNLQFDTTGYLSAGAGYLYERTAAGWNFKSVLTPSNAVSLLQFGDQLAMDSLGETVVISSFGDFSGPGATSGKSSVYVYNKPAAGWISTTESELINLPNTTDNVSNVAISDDGLTLIVSQNEMYCCTSNPVGKVWIYNRPNKQTNFSASSPDLLPAPATTMGFGADIAIDKKNIVVTCSSYHDSTGIFFIYKRDKASAYPLLATLRSGATVDYHGPSIQMTNTLISITGIKEDSQGTGGYPALFNFTKSASSPWSDTVKAVVVPFAPNLYLRSESSAFSSYAIVNDSTIAMSFQYTDNPVVSWGDQSKGRVEVISRKGSRWTNVQRTTILDELLPRNYIYTYSYGSGITWNGKQLLTVATLDFTGSTSVNSVTSLTLSNGVWGSQLKFTAPGQSANDFQFGEAIAYSGTNLIVGIPQDGEAGPEAGAVVIYKQDPAQNWIQARKILPPFNQVTDRYYGGTIAASDSMLVVSATNYGGRNADNQVGGKILLYNRTGSDWTSFAPAQEIQSPEHVYLFGSELAINNKLLVASGIDGLNNNNTNSLIIYERTSSSYSFKQIFHFTGALRPSSEMKVAVMGDTIFVLGGLNQYYTIGGFSILTKGTDGLWQVNSTLVLPSLLTSNAFFPLLRASLEVTKDHIFVGVPTALRNGKSDVGLVVTFAKSGGKRWPPGDIPYTSIVYPKDTVAGGYFGAAVKSIENSLVIGAPGANFTFPDGVIAVPRKIPGATYILTAQDYYWNHYEQLYKFQGTYYSTAMNDQMGYRVDASHDQYFVGAPYENNALGAQAGAVYTIPTPPLVRQMEPVCKNTAPLHLFGYPFGGTWSGPGITDAVNGIFDPASLDSGSYQVTYITPNCAYPGKIIIDIKRPPVVNLLTANTIEICPENPQILSVEVLPSNGFYRYQWYFKDVNKTSFVALNGQTTPTLTVSVAGLYYCNVTSELCDATSPVTTVMYETNSVSIGPQPVLCQNTMPVQLTVSAPSEGEWSGPNFQNGLFNPQGLSNGKYPVTFSFVSAKGCHYSLKDTVTISFVPPPTIAQIENDYCISGLFRVGVTTSMSPGLLYRWKFRATLADNWKLIDSVSMPSRTFVLAGYYQVEISNSLCSAVSNSLYIGADHSLAINNTPNDSTLKRCNEQNVLLTATARENTSFLWYFSEKPNGPFTNVGTDNSITASASGYYKVSGTLGFCFSETAVQHIIFAPADSLVVPNVFTPNDDDFNAAFVVGGNVKPDLAVIVNRWGTEVYRSTDVHWNGGDCAAGVYFYTITYRNCLNEESKARGFVQLIR